MMEDLALNLNQHSKMDNSQPMAPLKKKKRLLKKRKELKRREKFKQIKILNQDIGDTCNLFRVLRQKKKTMRMMIRSSVRPKERCILKHLCLEYLNLLSSLLPSLNFLQRDTRLSRNSPIHRI